METKTEQMLSSEGKRMILNQIMEYYHFGSQTQLANRLGLSTQNMSSWFCRGSFNAELIATCFPDLSGDWLLTGKGSMLKKNRDTAQPMNIVGNEIGVAINRDMQTALLAILEEQKLTAKAQSQADKMLFVLQSLAASFKRLQREGE